MATATVDRPRMRLSTPQLVLAIALFVLGNLWVVWLGAHVADIDALSARSDGIIALRRLPENPYRPLIRRAIIGVVYNAIMVTGLVFLVFVNYMEDERRLRLGLPFNAPEERIFGKRARARTDPGRASAPLRISRQVRPGVRVDLRCHLHPRMMRITKRN